MEKKVGTIYFESSIGDSDSSIGDSIGGVSFPWRYVRFFGQEFSFVVCSFSSPLKYDAIQTIISNIKLRPKTPSICPWA